MSHEIEEYAKVVLVAQLGKTGWPDAFVRKSDLIEKVAAEILPELEAYDPRLSQLTFDSLIEEIFQDLEQASGFIKTADRYAGEYYTVNAANVQAHKQQFLQTNPIYALASQIGAKRFFSDVFAGFRQDPDADRADPAGPLAPPADNRILLVTKEAVAEIEPSLGQVIEAVRSDNELSSHPELKDRILGQLKAGRELLLSGVVKAQLLYWVLLRALGELVDRYGKKAIGVAAAKLIELIIEEVVKK